MFSFLLSSWGKMVSIFCELLFTPILVFLGSCLPHINFIVKTQKSFKKNLIFDDVVYVWYLSTKYRLENPNCDSHSTMKVSISVFQSAYI